MTPTEVRGRASRRAAALVMIERTGARLGAPPAAVDRQLENVLAAFRRVDRAGFSDAAQDGDELAAIERAILALVVGAKA